LTPNLILPDVPGSYALFLELPDNLSLQIGRLGRFDLPAGRYIYVGSAMGGLGHRIRRHLRRDKPLRWHIDYLTAIVRPTTVWIHAGHERVECRLASDLSARAATPPVIPKFGSSDCRCPTHLVRLPPGFAATAPPSWCAVDLI
jgi:Uri superfamily endonuclease